MSIEQVYHDGVDVTLDQVSSLCANSPETFIQINHKTNDIAIIDTNLTCYYNLDIYNYVNATHIILNTNKLTTSFIGQITIFEHTANLTIESQAALSFHNISLYNFSTLNIFGQQTCLVNNLQATILNLNNNVTILSGNITTHESSILLEANTTFPLFTHNLIEFSGDSLSLSSNNNNSNAVLYGLYQFARIIKINSLNNLYIDKDAILVSQGIIDINLEQNLISEGLIASQHDSCLIIIGKNFSQYGNISCATNIWLTASHFSDITESNCFAKILKLEITQSEYTTDIHGLYLSEEIIELKSSQDILIQQKALLKSNQNITIIGKGSFENKGSIIASGPIEILTKTSITNYFHIKSFSFNITSSNGDFINYGRIDLDDHFTLILSNENSVLLNSGSVINTGSFSINDLEGGRIKNLNCNGCDFTANNSSATNIFKVDEIKISAANYVKTSNPGSSANGRTWKGPMHSLKPRMRGRAGSGGEVITQLACVYKESYSISNIGSFKVAGSADFDVLDLNVDLSNFVIEQTANFINGTATLSVTTDFLIQYIFANDYVGDVFNAPQGIAHMFGMSMSNTISGKRGSDYYVAIVTKKLNSIFYAKDIIGQINNIQSNQSSESYIRSYPLGAAACEMHNHKFTVPIQHGYARVTTGENIPELLSNKDFVSNEMAGSVAIANAWKSDLESRQVALIPGSFVDNIQFVFKPFPLYQLLSNTPTSGLGYELHYLNSLNPIMSQFFGSQLSPAKFLQQLAFNSNKEITGLVPVIGDEHYLQKSIDYVVFNEIGRLANYDSTQLLQKLEQNAIELYGKGEITVLPGMLIPQGDYSLPFIWPVWEPCLEMGVEKCLKFNFWFNQESIINMLEGASISAERMSLHLLGNVIINGLSQIKIYEELNLKVEKDVAVLGRVIGGMQTWEVKGQFINLGTIESLTDIVISAANILIGGRIKSNSTLDMNSMHNIILRSLHYTIESVTGNSYETTAYITQEASITASNEATLNAQGNIEIIGAQINAGSVDVKANGKVISVPIALYKEATNWGKKYYYSYKSLKQYCSGIGSTSGGVSIESGSGILLNGITIKSAANGSITAKEGDVIIESPEEYEHIVSYTKKKRGGISGFVGGSKTYSFEQWLSSPIKSSIKILSDLLVTSTGNQVYVATNIIARSVKLQAGSAEHQAMISLIPGSRARSIYLETKTTGFSFESDSNGMGISTSITMKSMDSSVEIIPSIMQIEKDFLVSVNGTWQQISSEVMSNGAVYINASNIILDAVPDMKYSYSYITKQGIGIGFSEKSGEFAIQAGAVYSKESSSNAVTQYKSLSKITANFIKLNAEDNLSTYAAIFNTQEMEMNARIIYHGIVKDSISQEATSEEAFAGIKLGIKSNIGQIIDNSQAIAETDYSRGEGFVNAYFKAQALYDDVLTILSKKTNHGISGGLWFYADYTKSTYSSTQSYSIPTIMSITGMLNSESEELRMIGTQVQAYNAYIKTKYFSVEAAVDEYSSKSKSQTYDVEIPIKSNIPPSLSASLSKGDSYQKIIIQANINIASHLNLVVDGHANMSGIFLSAGSLDAFFESLMLESLQDISKSHSWGINGGISRDQNNNFKGSTIGGSDARHESHVVERLTAMLGTQRAYIVVKQKLELIGAMIASAERDDSGVFTDHGNLVLKVGEFAIQHIYDYDEGYTLGMSYGSKANTASVGGNKGKGETKATIGKTINELTDLPEDTNRDVQNSQSWSDVFDLQTINMYQSKMDREEVKSGIIQDNEGNLDIKATLKSTWDTIKETMPFIFPTKVIEPTMEDIRLSRSNEDESSENDVDTTSVTDEDSDSAENTEEKKEKADNQETSSNSKEQYKEQEEQDHLSFKVYDEAAGPTYNQEIKNSLRIESQRKEILESLTTQFNKAEERDQIVAFKRLDQVYIVSKHIVGGGVLMSKAVFAENFPNMYDTLATYSDKLGQFIGKNINNIDTKLINTLGDKYDSFKHYTSEIFAEVDKNAPQFVSDGLALFAIAGAGKVVFSTVEAGVVGATKIGSKLIGKEAINKIDDIADFAVHNIEDGTLIKNSFIDDLTKIDLETTSKFELGKISTASQHQLLNKLPDHIPNGRIDYTDRFSSSLKNFSPGTERLFHGKITEDLYLINYHDKNKIIGLGEGKRTLTWATHLEVGNRLPSTKEIHQHLALVDPDWGVRNSYSVIKIPAGEQVTFISGKAVSQVSKKGEEFIGGGYQVRFRDFNEKWIIETKDLNK